MNRSIAHQICSWGCLLLVALTPAASRAEPPAPQPSSTDPETPPPAAAAAPAAQDPFARLKVVIPLDKLPPLASVRRRGEQEMQDRSQAGNITVSIHSSPSGARVLYGGKLLGTTPLSITAPRYSTPYDVVLQRGKYMTLHARIKRIKSRSYHFKLTPAKFH